MANRASLNEFHLLTAFLSIDWHNLDMSLLITKSYPQIFVFS